MSSHALLPSTSVAWSTFALALGSLGLFSACRGLEDATLPRPPQLQPPAPPPLTPPLQPRPPRIDSLPLQKVALPLGKIAFVSTRDGAPHIYIATAGSPGITRLTEGDRPTWSSDGRRLAFHWSGEIRIVNADGSGMRSLVRGSHPAWSPDGSTIAFSRVGTDGGIWLMQADGSRPPRRILSARLCACGTAWSRDGTTLVYAVSPDSGYYGNLYTTPTNLIAEVGVRWFIDDYGASDPVWAESDQAAVFGFRGGIGGGGWWDYGTAVIVSGPAFDPVYSPDWRYLAFTYSVGPRTRLGMLDSGSLKQLDLEAGVPPNRDYSDYHPAWAK